MTPLDNFPGANTRYVAKGCNDLMGKACEENGHSVVETHWKPSQEELNTLITGGVVVLRIMAINPQPVALSVASE